MRNFSRVIWGLVVLAAFGLVAFVFYKSWKLAMNVVANEKLKLENERAKMLYQLNLARQEENFKLREPIGFKAS